MYLVSRTETFAKLFFIVSFTGLFMYVTLAFYSFHTAYTTSQIFERLLPVEEFSRDLKHILVWTVNNHQLIREGEAPFIDFKCPDINCYITANKTHLRQYTNFDAIIFNLTVLSKWQISLLPKHRFERQKYVFYSKQASEDNPICNKVVDNYFNWTWTYKLGSDIFSPFIEVRDLGGNVVAPKANVVWTKTVYNPATLFGSAVDIEEINTKTKAVAWVIDNCKPRANNLISVKSLQKALAEHSLSLDVYGCGYLKCPQDGCLSMIEKDYFFYLAYEHSVSEDYVTDEVLKAYHHDAVPIVVGGADYTKFLPDHSYINFKDFTEEKLAIHIALIIRNPSKYREYFSWKKLYTIQKVEEFQGYCQLCSLLNNEGQFNQFSVYQNFRQWWYYGSLREKCLPKGAERFSEVLSYSNKSY